MGNHVAERASSGLRQIFDCQKTSELFPFGFVVTPNEQGERKWQKREKGCYRKLLRQEEI